MLKICLVFWESEPQYAYKLHAYKKKTRMKKSVQPFWRKVQKHHFQHLIPYKTG